MANNSKKSYIVALFTNKCPRCREGYLFHKKSAYQKNSNQMHAECPVCGQPTEIEVGFYYGTGYVSYALSIAFLVTTFVAWKILIGVTFSVDDNRIFYWMGISFTLLFALQPVMIRLSRILWLSWFVSYDPDWKNHPFEKPERIVPEQMNNW
jgi:endogenous inhibitor of DNA gyrase (YacG/DUF329 family)